MDDSFITCDEIILFHFEARTWHDDNIQSSTPYRKVLNTAQLFEQLS